MSQLPHDPNSLSEELDRVLPPGQSGQNGASNDPLVQAAARLSAAPRPALSPEALTRIHATMQAAQSTPPPARSLTRGFLRQSAPVRLAVAAVLVFVFVSGAIFAARIGVQLLQAPTTTETVLPPSATPIPPTATPLPPSPTSTVMNTDTATPLPPSPTATSLITQLPLVVATIQPTTTVPTATPTTAVPTSAASPTLVPTTTLPVAPVTASVEASTAEPTFPVTIVIEGPIQSINGTTIIIFDLTIVLSTEDVASIHVGDTVRVEGYYDSDTQVIIAVHVTVLRNTPIPPNSSVETNPSTGQVWTDPGDCSNPPPPWAPANGWRRRCQGAPNPGNSGENGNDNGNSNGNANGNGNGNGNGKGMGG